MEAGQTIKSLTLTVSNATDSNNEILGIDGSDVSLTNSSGSTATVTILGDKSCTDKEWQIKFTKEADETTITKENVYVLDSSGNKVEVKVSYDSDNILKVAPVNPYKSGETYCLYITF